MSVLRTGRGRAGGGGGGGILNWKCSWGLKTPPKKKYFFWGGGGGRKISEFFFPTKIFFLKNASPCKQIFFFRGGGGFWGVWGAPRPHPGVARGRKTIHFFLWP